MLLQAGPYQMVPICINYLVCLSFFFFGRGKCRIFSSLSFIGYVSQYSRVPEACIGRTVEQFLETTFSLEMQKHLNDFISVIEGLEYYNYSL